MYLDAQQLFSDAQALTATAVSTNLIDLGSDRNIGVGEQMCVVINFDVGADFTTTDETYQFDLQTDDNSSFSSATVVNRRVVANADAALINSAGKRLVLALPADNSVERYLRLNFTLAGTTPSATVTAHLQPMSMVQAEAVYADGITIS